MTEPEPEPLELRPHTSVILEALFAGTEARQMVVDDLMATLRGRAYGLILLVVSILSLLPGISFLGGVVIIVFAAQMAVGRTAPALPSLIGRRAVPVTAVGRWVGRVLPALRFVERFVEPRLALATIMPARVIAGILLIGLGITLLIPLPFTQIAPALAAAVVSIGLLERDGIAFLIGVGLAFMALLLTVWMTMVAWNTVAGVLG